MSSEKKYLCKSNSSILVLCLVVGLFASGCGGGTLRFDMYEGLGGVHRGWQAEERDLAGHPRQAPLADPIVVNLIVPESLGCLREDSGGGNCQSFEAQSREQLRTHINTAIRADQAAGAVVIDDYNRALTEIFQHRFDERFSNVTILVNSPNPPPGTINVRFSFVSTVIGGIQSNATLSVSTTAAPLGSIEGNEALPGGYGHLGWFIPCALLVPIGTAFALVGVRKLQERRMMEGVAGAIDDAARQLAQRLAADIRQAQMSGPTASLGH